MYLPSLKRGTHSLFYLGNKRGEITKTLDAFIFELWLSTIEGFRLVDK